MNYAQKLAGICDAFAKAYDILNECRALGYFDEHSYDSGQEQNLKQDAITWIEDFEACGKEL